MRPVTASRRIVVIAIAVVLVGGLGLAALLMNRRQPPDPDEAKSAKVTDVVSGHKVEIKPEDHLSYAGIHAPYPNEPFGKEALELNRKLVEGKTVRLRFDETPKDRKGRWLAYVFADREFVNKRLVAEGLAYARLKAAEQRFAKELLAAQNEARVSRRGIWSVPIKETEDRYPGDRKHASFHRPGCEDVANTRPGNEVMFSSKNEAFSAGFVPCRHCSP